MGRYIFKVPVAGVEYYEVEADSVEEAAAELNDAWEIPEECIDSVVSFSGDFELSSVLEPGIDDKD